VTPEAYPSANADRTPTDGPTMAPVLYMDTEAIAKSLINLVLASYQMGHSRPRESLTYTHPASPEAQLVVDIVGGMSTKELADKWFGGSDGIRDFLIAAMDGGHL
jgi:hypothetical protein